MAILCMSFTSVLLACLLFNGAMSADPGETGLSSIRTDPRQTGLSTKYLDEFVGDAIQTHGKSRRNANMQLLESESFPLRQVFNGLRIVKSLALKINGQRPPRPSVRIILS